MSTTIDDERRKLFEAMRQLHADNAFCAKVVADVRKLAADPVWSAERAEEPRRPAESAAPTNPARRGSDFARWVVKDS